jgi:regulator of protease activity HflC (stomatin/prohibitin superfamily)
MMPGLDGIFTLLGEILKLLLSWVPQPVLINVTQRGVRFRLGRDPIYLKPGLWWTVPLFSTIEVVSVLDDATEYEPVVLTTSDDKSVAIGFVTVWCVEPDNVIKSQTTTDDLGAMVGELGESLLPAIVLNYTFEQLLERIRGARGQKKFDLILHEGAQERLEHYGITVRSCRINFVSKSRVFKLIQS